MGVSGIPIDDPRTDTVDHWALKEARKLFEKDPGAAKELVKEHKKRKIADRKRKGAKKHRKESSVEMTDDDDSGDPEASSPPNELQLALPSSSTNESQLALPSSLTNELQLMPN